MVAGDRCTVGGAAASKICHATKQAANRTPRAVPAAPCADCLAFNPVFLRGEGEGDVVCGCQGGEWIDCGIEDALSAAEGDVAQAEWSGVIGGAGVAVLAWSEEEIETDPDDVRDALVTGVAADMVAEDVMENCDGEWLDARWRRILSCVAAKLARYAEVSISVRVVAGVAGPQAGKDLSHGAEVLLHLSLADALAVDGELARSHAMRKNLEKGDGIGDVREVGVKVELRAEL